MTDEPAATTTPDPAPAEPAKEPDKSVPYDRFKKVNDKSKELETQLAAAKEALEERETADMGELDKLKRDLEKAQKRADENEAKATEAATAAQNLERAGWVRSEAQKLGFTDPDDAVDLAKAKDAFGSLDSDTEAAKFVKTLAESKKHLISKQPDERPGLSKILSGPESPTTEPTDKKAAQREEEAKVIVDQLKSLVR